MSKIHTALDAASALTARPAMATPRSRSLLWTAATAALVLLGTGCTNMHYGNSADKATSAMDMDSNHMDRAVAQAQMKTPEGAVTGMATLTSLQGGGVEIAVQMQGMKPGPHGFHIHTKGECAPSMDAATGKMVAFGAAGGHFDPHDTKTHGQPGRSSQQIHAGDVPNLVVGSSGSGMLRYTSKDVSLMPGDNSIIGRSLVVHEGEDDYKTNPAGNSGPRIACGVIEMVQGQGMDHSNMAQGHMPAAGQPAMAR